MASFTRLKEAVFSKEHRKRHFEESVAGLNAFDRHKKFVNDYVRFYGPSAPGSSSGAAKTDHDILKESFRFIRTDEDDAEGTWEQRLAKRYYDKLFKEYCVADMSRYKESKIGLRWRTEREVLAGKGQFICGAKGCDLQAGLHSFEVNFGYMEAGQRKQALVKLRVCPRHAMQLNYKKDKELQRKRKEEEHERKRAERKRKKRRKPSGSDSVESGDERSEGEPEKEAAEGHREAEQQRGEGGFTAGAEEKSQGEGLLRPAEGSQSGQQTAGAGVNEPASETNSAHVWAPKELETEATKEDEFDQYFQDLLL